MIRSILQSIEQNILDLGFIERYGALVIAITDYTTNEQGEKTEITFPISADITGRQCFEQGQYYDLAPNDKYKSVAYWEADNAASRKTSKHGGKYWEYSQQVRFVSWLNLANLGVQMPYDYTPNIIFALINEVEKGIDEIPTTPITNVKIKYSGQPPKSMEIFRKYSYGNKATLLLYPFDFFAIDFVVTWTVRKDCIMDEYEYEKIECINQSLIEPGFTKGFTIGYES